VHPIESFRETIEFVSTALSELSVRFHVTGGAAANAYGDPRMTQDLDFVVDQAAIVAVLPRFLDRFGAERFYFDSASVDSAVRAGKQFQILDMQTTTKLDFYPRELIKGELSRSVVVEFLPGLRLPVVSRVDAVLSKLIWISRGSERSRRDLRKLAARLTPLDLESVRNASESMSLRPLLDEVLGSTDEVE
jgi:hypothetical protein